MATTLIHPTAVIHPDAQLHPTVEVGAYAVIGDNVKVGPDTTIGAHAVIEGPTEIGARNQIFPGAAIGLAPQDLKYDGAPSWVRIGDDNRIREYVTINRATGAGAATAIGNNNLLMAYVHVAHNCRIGDSVVIANSVALAGYVHIESKATIGGVLGIHQFVHIGRLAMVGGMSRIDRDVPPYMLVEGNPSRVRSLNLVGLKRAGMSAEELGQLKKAFRTLYRSGHTLNESLELLNLLPDSEDLQHLCRFLRLSQMPGRRGLIPGRRLKHED
ncbi:acyl-ACP--UDP-N-acetylglucosamine O-acyltransferase [Limnofasciculus baicalensis]|uniref:Acyl-[acyl-carrier-protein]--UDP-N-acetylglucosamine O-acyltransferase n=1 Tax=Limnofasciculus baicalensis BBK-W-15 TaxID=2699891 RepID=A0AAE3KM68_9CYAN|nr:acyl-ACP--UDP-N-acetylglucosamine O-acyltransferase [Limnofasciculus baicalensis]MCP2728491.1 acyl-ACP--UDP-N-acetylglucosamine O-acyltransferase [Limnofasciculus baicalensis BBK-W-15]